MLFEAKGGRDTMEERLEQMCVEAEKMIDNGCITLSLAIKV